MKDEAKILKPCPFCGYTLSDYDAVAVIGIHDKDSSCILSGFKVVGWGGAERWNKRASKSSPCAPKSEGGKTEDLGEKET